MSTIGRNHHNKVDLGVWKLVIIASGMLHSYGGKINLLVHPENGLSSLFTVTEDSKALVTVVPIAQTFLLFNLASLTNLTVSSPT